MEQKPVRMTKDVSDSCVTHYQRGYDTATTAMRKWHKEVLGEVFSIITRENYLHYPKWEQAVIEAHGNIPIPKGE